MNTLHIVFALISVWRITEIVTQDQIFAKIRSKWPHYFWTCGRCVSVWASLLAVLGYHYFPFANWPFAFSWIFTAQVQLFIWMFQKPKEEPHTRTTPSIMLTEGPGGTVQVSNYGLTQGQSNEIIVRLASLITTQAAEPKAK